MSTPELLLVLLAVAFAFDFLNGVHDSADAVATIIASRAMSARGALALAAAASLAGPFLLGIAVAETVGAGLVRPQSITIAVVIAALLAAGLCNAVTWYIGVPVSSSHALIGGVVGAAAAGSGLAAVQAQGLWKVALALLLSPLLGFVAALAVMHVLWWLLREATPKANVALSRAQVLAAAALAMSQGANNAQKTAGMISLGLVTLGVTPAFAVPWWAIALSASAIALGTAVGGRRIIRTLGVRLYRIRPIHSFAAQTSSAAVILGMSFAGGPVSTTQVTSLAIVGAGAAERKSQVRWSALAQIAIAWVLTLPAAMLLAIPLHYLVEVMVKHGG
ncbi:MAG TPA: inorganic phosphate transporter [Burkholderiales bacterium]|nr:inorganic phosphate transporter [Burkholderiales bacterium]